ALQGLLALCSPEKPARVLPRYGTQDEPGSPRKPPGIGTEYTAESTSHHGVWCNWQHNGFWYRHSRFESWYHSASQQSLLRSPRPVRLAAQDAALSRR